MKNNTLKGSIFLALGASSYGLLGTFVKMAYRDGFSTAEITLSQFSLGFAGLFVLALFQKRPPAQGPKTPGIKSILRLLLAGTSLGLTSVFFYKAIEYIPVGTGIVLIMQAVWMGVVLEIIQKRQLPDLRKIASVFIILTGTILATNMLQQPANINWTGFGRGLMAALCYTATMYSSANLELYIPPLQRSLYMILGGLIVIALIFYSVLVRPLSYEILLNWGPILALFGTIFPPLFFTEGMPLTGIGLGAIITAIEIPVAVLSANLLLHEPVSSLQWIGVILILMAIVLMNSKKKRK